MKRERTTPESPKRGRGRPKGTPKSPGSGRQKRTRLQIAKDQARDSIWSYVVKGLSSQAVKSRGPTGKAISQPLTEDNQIRLLQTAWRKLEPDLNATAVTADIVTEHVHKESKDPRQVARAVLSVLEHAKLAEQAEHPVADPFVDPRPAPHQLLIGRDAVIELQANSDQPLSTAAALVNEEGASGEAPSSSLSNGTANNSSVLSGSGELSGQAAGSLPSGETGEPAVSPSIPSPSKRPHGFRVDSETHNKAHMLWHSDLKKWFFFDSTNVEHGAQAGVRRDDEKALERLAEIPKAEGPWQPHPWSNVPQSSDLLRRDNGPTRRDSSKIVRRMPRSR